jgi:hypothetical protein
LVRIDGAYCCEQGECDGHEVVEAVAMTPFDYETALDRAQRTREQERRTAGNPKSYAMWPYRS